MLCAECRSSPKAASVDKVRDLVQKEVTAQMQSCSDGLNMDVQTLKDQVQNLQHVISALVTGYESLSGTHFETMRLHKHSETRMPNSQLEQNILGRATSRSSSVGASLGNIGEHCFEQPRVDTGTPKVSPRLADIVQIGASKSDQIDHTHISESPSIGFLKDVLQYTKSMLSKTGAMTDKDRSSYSKGLHGFAVRAASHPSMHAGWAILFVCLSACVVMFLVILLFSIILAASHPRCVQNDYCRLGEYCDATSDISKPGHCKDCYSATRNESLAFCMTNDKMPLRCDFLDHNLLTMTPCHVIIMSFVAMTLCLEVYDDLKEAVEELVEFNLVSEPIVNTLRCRLLRGFMWWSTRLRLFVIPVQTMGAAAALLLNEQMSVQNIVLNGAGIGFILRVDDMIGQSLPFFVRYHAEAVQIQKDECPVDRLDYLYIGFETVVLCMLLLVMVLAPEHIMLLVGDEQESSGWAYPCSNIVNVCRDFPWVAGVCLAYGMALYNLAVKRSTVLRSLVEITLLTVLGSVHYRFLKFFWTPYSYLEPQSAAFRP